MAEQSSRSRDVCPLLTGKIKFAFMGGVSTPWFKLERWTTAAPFTPVMDQAVPQIGNEWQDGAKRCIGIAISAIWKADIAAVADDLGVGTRRRAY
jgi:hypothetical protein